MSKNSAQNTLTFDFTFEASYDWQHNFQKMSLPGKPVSILTINPDESFTLDEDALKTVLSSKEIKNKPICLVPVAGQFFFLKF